MLIDWLPDQASEQRERIDFVFWFATVICIAIFAIVAGGDRLRALKFRARPDDDTDGPPIHGHTGLEIAWTAVPAVLVTAIAIVSAIVLAQNERAGDNPLRIEVTAQQFAWSFKYPGERPHVGDLRLPLDRPIVLSMTATTSSTPSGCRSSGRSRTSSRGSRPGS